MGSQTKNSHSLQSEMSQNKVPKFQKMEKPATFLNLCDVPSDCDRQVEEVSLADDSPPAAPEPVRYPSGTASLDLPPTPDDPSLSPPLADHLAGSLMSSTEVRPS